MYLSDKQVENPSLMYQKYVEPLPERYRYAINGRVHQMAKTPGIRFPEKMTENWFKRIIPTKFRQIAEAKGKSLFEWLNDVTIEEFLASRFPLNTGETQPIEFLFYRKKAGLDESRGVNLHHFEREGKELSPLMLDNLINYVMYRYLELSGESIDDLLARGFKFRDNITQVRVFTGGKKEAFTPDMKEQIAEQCAAYSFEELSMMDPAKLKALPLRLGGFLTNFEELFEYYLIAYEKTHTDFEDFRKHFVLSLYDKQKVSSRLQEKGVAGFFREFVEQDWRAREITEVVGGSLARDLNLSLFFATYKDFFEAEVEDRPFMKEFYMIRVFADHDDSEILYKHQSTEEPKDINISKLMALDIPFLRTKDGRSLLFLGLKNRLFRSLQEHRNQIGFLSDPTEVLLQLREAFAPEMEELRCIADALAMEFKGDVAVLYYSLHEYFTEVLELSIPEIMKEPVAAERDETGHMKGTLLRDMPSLPQRMGMVDIRGIDYRKGLDGDLDHKGRFQDASLEVDEDTRLALLQLSTQEFHEKVTPSHGLFRARKTGSFIEGVIAAFGSIGLYHENPKSEYRLLVLLENFFRRNEDQLKPLQKHLGSCMKDSFLTPYQFLQELYVFMCKEPSIFGRNMNLHILDSSEMGTGKTITSILGNEYILTHRLEDVQAEFAHRIKTLVISPSGLKPQWQERLYVEGMEDRSYFKQPIEVARFDRGHELKSPSDELITQLDQARYIVTNYELLREGKNLEYLVDLLSQVNAHIHCIILDEVHKAKNLKSKVTKMVNRLCTEFFAEAKRILLSGTPIPNTIEDIWAQIYLLYANLFAHAETEKEREAMRKAFEKSLKNNFQIRALLQDRMLSRRQSEVMELPTLNGLETKDIYYNDPRFYSKFDVPLEELLDIKRFCEEEMEARVEIAEGSSTDVIPRQRALLRAEWGEGIDSSRMRMLRKELNRFLGIAHLEYDASHPQGRLQIPGVELEDTYLTHRINLEEAKREELPLKKIPIFNSFLKEGVLSSEPGTFYSKLLKEYGPEGLGYEIILITGDDDTADKKNAKLEQFVRAERAILLGQLEVIGEGYDHLVCTDKGIFLDMPWTESRLDQGIKRLYRGGQNQPVEVKILEARGTFDEYKRAKVFYKKQLIELYAAGMPLTDEQLQYIKVKTYEVGGGFKENFEYDAYRKVLDRMFLQCMEKGEDFLKNKSEEWKRQYADLYVKLEEMKGEATYQANNNRAIATFMCSISEELGVPRDKVLDLASGPLMLQRRLPDSQVLSLDINAHILQRGAILAEAEGLRIEPDHIIHAGYSELPKLVEEASMDMVNLAHALQYTRCTASELERKNLLMNIHRILKEQGICTITIPKRMLATQDETHNLQSFLQACEDVGFTVLDQYTGTIASSDNVDGYVFQSVLITLQKSKPLNEDIRSDRFRFTTAKKLFLVKGSEKKKSEKRKRLPGARRRFTLKPLGRARITDMA